MAATYTVQHFNDATVSEIRDNQLGGWRLICTCGRFNIKKHCTHVEHVMKNRIDAERLQSRIQDGDYDDIIVPIFINPFLRIIAQVDVRPGTFTEVSAFISQAESVGLGYLMKGDGRHDIRVMFYEWILGQVEAVVHATELTDWEFLCVSPHHHSGNRNVLAGWRETADGQEQKKMLVNWWTLISTHQCADCEVATHVDIF